MFEYLFYICTTVKFDFGRKLDQEKREKLDECLNWTKTFAGTNPRPRRASKLLREAKFALVELQNFF